MAARTVTTREFQCNHCNGVDIFDNDADAGKAGWALVRVNGQEFALCADHYDELKRFLNVDTLGGMPGTVEVEGGAGAAYVPSEPGYGQIMGQAVAGYGGQLVSGGGLPGMTLTQSQSDRLAAEAADAEIQRRRLGKGRR